MRCARGLTGNLHNLGNAAGPGRAGADWAAQIEAVSATALGATAAAAATHQATLSFSAALLATTAQA
jgi:hypothetical protein